MMSGRSDVYFMGERLVGKAGTRGRSSDALIAAAICGSVVPDNYYPRDLGDLGRCCEAFALAPYDVRERMLPTLRLFIESLSAAEGKVS